jgi:hypothetical protein
MIEVNVIVRDNKNNDGLVDLEIDVKMLSTEWDLLRWFKGDDYEMKKMVRTIADINPLGRYLYNYFKRKGDYYKLTNASLKVPREIADPEYMNEISRYITMYLTEALVYAIDIPEVHEHVATLTLPEFAIEQLRMRNITPDFKADFELEKERGFNHLVIKQNVDSPGIAINYILNYIAESTSYLNIELDSTNIDREIIIGRNDEIIIPYSSIRSNLQETVEKVKEEIQKKVQEIEDRGLMNLVLAILYRRLDYSTSIELFKEKELSQYTIPEITIKRPLLFDDITISFKLRTPLIDKLRRNMTTATIEVDTDEGKFNSTFKISAPEQVYTGHIIVPKKLKEERAERLIKGDISVIQEVQDIDNRVVSQILNGLKDQIIHALLENRVVTNNMGKYRFNDTEYTFGKFQKGDGDVFDFYTETKSQNTSLDIIDTMPEDKKEKLTTYLVSEKIKNSMGA